ncbi:outer membrane protein assembly factor BamA [Pedobacter glucosidilyticus]|uniref:Outer membrane protein assembly factor BamA n=1 Tax=Pedobacter aquae TaxID=2605747 RepID=A0A5C0VEP9_9SPHI|nr:MULTISPECIES: outer membrane protein assembly factor BamA [Pedobacter]KHJ38530.1 outer membrane protein assembly factor BamA [Pedobacter glucosidilyticus]QEK50547.1 outer membrane protein assembly factor BamA [Pedobacter aquae]
MKKLFLAIIFINLCFSGFAQLRPSSRNNTPKASDDEIGYLNPKEYTIAGIKINGVNYLDTAVLLTISKLAVGDRIMVPGEATSAAVKNLWDQRLFEDIELSIAKIQGDSVYFDLNLVEVPRVSSIKLSGLTKSETTEIQEKLNNQKSKVVNENLNKTINAIIKKHFFEKGYLNTEIDITYKADTSDANSKIVNVKVDKNNKVKVNAINIEGNKEFNDAKLKKFMKKTHEQAWYKVFGSGKFIQEKYEEDKDKLVAKMREKGYREAEIVSDSIYPHDKNAINIDMKIHEGPKYYFGNVTFVGNAKYPTSILKQVLKIEKGEVFSEEKLEKTLRSSPNSDDVSSLYLNDGYLTFNVDPVQTKIYNDTIDLEIRIFEGPQYTINKIILKGNELTNDQVVLREIRTKPGQKFSKDALIRSQRQITQLGNFDEQKVDIKPIPNPADGTVDIQYTVVEKPSDQIELSGGFGGGRVVGTLGLTFNNFSAKNLFNLKAYKPLPKGDGQKLSIRGQTNGKFFQSYSFSFSEPWFGGKKPIYFGISAFTSLQSNGLANSNPVQQKIRLNGVTFSLGKQLKWPDDFFRVDYSANLQQFRLKNYAGYLFENGDSYDLSLSQVFSRNSIDAPIFPTSGSNIKFTVQATLPYSAFNGKNYGNLPTAERYKFTEYHKWKFESQFFQRVYGKMILKAQAQFGFLGFYSKEVGQAPFGRFRLGGDGLQAFDFLQGSEVIGLRGYANNAVVPEGAPTTAGSPIFNKYVLELRHPITLSESAQVFALTFMEGGNTWNRFADFNPFNVKRSVGVGARIFLPIFGLLGIDYGYAFDRIPGQQDGGRQPFTFSIAQQLGGFN